MNMEFQCSYYTIGEYVKNYGASTWHIKKYPAALEGVKSLRTTLPPPPPSRPPSRTLNCPSLNQ